MSDDVMRMLIEARKHRFWGSKTVWLASNNLEELQDMMTTAKEAMGVLSSVFEVHGKQGDVYYMAQLEHYALFDVTVDHIKKRFRIETFHCDDGIDAVREKVRGVIDMRYGKDDLPEWLGGRIVMAADHENTQGWHTLMVTLERNRAARTCVDGCEVGG